MKRIRFIEMMGEPGSYDARVYDHFEDRDQEGRWFSKRFGNLPGIEVSATNICVGESLPAAREVDGLVLAGSYNSVHDNTSWQQQVRNWLPQMTAAGVPVLAICGSHQLLAHMHGCRVEPVPTKPYAGTFPVQLSQAANGHPLFEGIADGAGFQFANTEHVPDVPGIATLLASSGRVPVAALDYGNHCYSTQFHPEGTDQTLSTVWRFKAPEKMRNYRPEDNGRRLVTNFLKLVVALGESSSGPCP